VELDRLPVRGEGVRDLGLALAPPGVAPVERGAPPLALMRGGRPLKRWRYVGAFGPELMLCAGDARIGPLRQRWWAVAEAGAPLRERTSMGSAGMQLWAEAPAALQGPDAASGKALLTVASRDVRLELFVQDEGQVEPVEVAARSGSAGWIWTRKRAGIPARARVSLGERRCDLELEAVVDDSAGYHARETAWRWSTGVGRAESGERVAWNLVTGVHDGPSASERTLWVDGRATEVGPARFTDDLSRVETIDGGGLEFSPWVAREHSTNLLLFRSRYRQPFGTFTGELPGGLRLAEGYGVMEEHDVRW
jgi:hypothetical protein